MTTERNAADGLAPARPGFEATTEEYHWGRFFTGTRESLIAAGVLEPGQFPGEPGNRKTSHTFATPDGREIQVRREERDGMAKLTRWTETEPRPSRKTSLRDAQRELRRFAIARRPK